MNNKNFAQFWLINYTPSYDTGLLLLRIGIGFLYVIHGYPKIIGGVPTWELLGNQMQLLGISFFPVMWGFIAALTEFFGGLFLILGLGIRIISALLCFTMMIATITLYSGGQGFDLYTHPLKMCIVFAAFIIMGGGRYSIHYLFNDQTKRIRRSK